VSDVQGFEGAFRRKMNRACSWDLWGAAYVVHGGVSDDGFDYFRRWLISQGAAVYAHVLVRPDDLADVLPIAGKPAGLVRRRSRPSITPYQRGQAASQFAGSSLAFGNLLDLVAW
jgi:Protein of unknown function (DUF4240)